MSNTIPEYSKWSDRFLSGRTYELVKQLTKDVKDLQQVVVQQAEVVKQLADLLTQEASSTEILAHRDQAIQASLKAAQERTHKSMWSTIHIPSDAPTPADPQDHGQQTC